MKEVQRKNSNDRDTTMIEQPGYQKNQEDQNHRELRIANVFLIAAIGLGSFYIFLSWQLQTWQMYVLSGILFTFIIAVLFARLLIMAGRTLAGIWILAIGLFVIIPVTVLLVADTGILFGISLLALIFLVIAQYLPKPQRIRVILIAVVIGVLTGTIEFIPLGFRLSMPIIQTIVPVITGIAITIGIFLYFRGLWRRSNIRTKLVLAFVLVTLVPVGVLGTQSIVISRNGLIEQAESDLFETAQAASVTLDVIIQSQLEAINSEAQHSDFLGYFEVAPVLRHGSVQEKKATRTLMNLADKNSNISSYALLDAQGLVLIDTFTGDIGKDKSDRDYYRIPLSTGEPYLSPFRFSQTTHEPSIYFSAPIVNSFGRTVGVLSARYDAKYLQELLITVTNTNNPEEYAVLLDNETYIRIAHSQNPELIYKSYASFTISEIEAFQKEFRFIAGDPYTAIFLGITHNKEMVDGVNNLTSNPVFIAPSSIYNNEPTYTGGHRLQNANWTVLVRRTERSILEPIQPLVNAIGGTVVLMIVIAIALGYVAARTLTYPITRLTDTVQKIVEGDLSKRAEITTQDETAALAKTFNFMSDQLQETLSGLEERIAERTSELEIAQQESEQRSRTLENIAEISSAISLEQNLDQMLSQVTRLVSQRLGYYHAGIFLIDETGRYAVLKAANSEGGKSMLERQHMLEVGQTGIVGHVAQTQEARIALDVGEDAVYFDNPDLPDTRSEIALPLLSRSTIIGILDVQSLEPNAFTEEDIRILNVLADQVATAIENVRLFEQTQQSLNELQDFYRQYIRQEWGALSSREKQIGYLKKVSGGNFVSEPVISKEIDQAIKAGDIVIAIPEKAKNEGSRQAVLAAPIQLHGETLGVLNIQNPAINRPWTQNEINMVKAIAERIALAIENARLLQDSQQRAAKEQVIAEITSKIGESINLNSVLQTAVEELGQFIPGSEVAIQFNSDRGD